MRRVFTRKRFVLTLCFGARGPQFAVLSVGSDSQISPGNRLIWRNFNKNTHVLGPVSDLNERSRGHSTRLWFENMCELLEAYLVTEENSK